MAAFAAGAADGRLLHAQSSGQGSAAADTELAAALQALRPGRLVQISVGGARDTGRVALATPHQLAFRGRTDRDAVPASSIDSLWTWTSNAGRGALTGAIAGGAVGVFMGIAIESAAQSVNRTDSRQFGRALGGGIAGGLVGALFGVSIGGRFSRWEFVYPRPRAP